jgi:hypothetical protein
MKEERTVVIARKYEMNGQTKIINVAQISGGDLTGTVLQCEVWLNGQEQIEKRITSGNAYTIRRAFITSLLDLHEDGWVRMEGATYGHSQLSFFDPSEL